MTKKWVEVNYLSSGDYSVNKNIRFKTYIVIKGTLDLLAGTANENAPFLMLMIMPQIVNHLSKKQK